MVPKSGNPTWKPKKFKNEVHYKELAKHTKYIVENIIPIHNALNGDQKWNLKKATKMQKLESKTIKSTTLFWTYVQTFNLVI